MRNWIVLALLLLGSTTADALGVDIVEARSTGASTSELQAGDEITFDLRFENSENFGMVAVGFVVTGYDPDANRIADNGLRFVRGEASSTLFSEVFAAGQSFGGLQASSGFTEDTA